MNHIKLGKNKEKGNNNKIMQDNKKAKIKIFTKRNILFLFIPMVIFIDIYLINNNPKTLELKRQIEELKSQIQKSKKKLWKKIKIGLVSDHIYLNGIARFLIILGGLLSKTEKYEVYLINQEVSN